MKNCAICDKELMSEDINLIRQTDLMLTCVEHNKYGTCANNEVTKLKLGIIKEYSDKWKKCEICECNLTQEDVDTFTENTVNPTCKKHRVAHNWWQIDIAKDWFDYCDYVGFDLNYSEQNNQKFQEWRSDKSNKLIYPKKEFWYNVKDRLPSHKKNVLGYFELWGDYRPSGEESSRHYELCFFDQLENKWFHTNNSQVLIHPSHWTELPKMPVSDIDQRINIGWKKDLKK